MLRNSPFGLLVVVALVFTATGCGKKKKKQSGGDGPAPTAAATPDAAPAMDAAPPADAKPVEATPDAGDDMAGDPTIPTKGQAAARMILIPWKGSAAPEAEKLTRTKSQAKALADKIVAQARATPTEKAFTKLAQQHNTGAMKSTGGKIAPFGPNDVAPLVAKAVFALKKNGISAPVESPAGFHIFFRTQ